MVGETIVGLIGLLLGAGCGFGGLLLHNKVRLRTARDQADAIVGRAGRDAEDVARRAELQVKEEAIRRREALEREAEEARKGFRDQEKRLEKRGDLLDQKLELINKKERDFETVQRYPRPSSRRS